MPEIWAIILAAGESVRMKTNKLLLPFQGKTILETAISNVMQSDIRNILVVLGAFREDVIRVISSLPVQHCYNSEYETGMLSSVQCGLYNIPASAETVLVFPGDQPLIPGKVAVKMLEEYRRSGKGIAVPVYRGKRGHPVLIDTKYRSEVAKLNRDEGLRALLHKFPEDVLEVETDTPGVLKDIDTPEDYRNLTQSK
jgi:molybdenum cofactor cytidylyltransferase